MRTAGRGRHALPAAVAGVRKVLRTVAGFHGQRLRDDRTMCHAHYGPGLHSRGRHPGLLRCLCLQPLMVSGLHRRPLVSLLFLPSKRGEMHEWSPQSVRVGRRLPERPAGPGSVRRRESLRDTRGTRRERTYDRYRSRHLCGAGLRRFGYGRARQPSVVLLSAVVPLAARQRVFERDRRPAGQRDERDRRPSAARMAYVVQRGAGGQGGGGCAVADPL